MSMFLTKKPKTQPARIKKGSQCNDMDAEVDERFGAPVVVKPHQSENDGDERLVAIDIDNILHGTRSSLGSKSRQ
jgi:hypothetical protein